MQISLEQSRATFYSPFLLWTHFLGFLSGQVFGCHKTAQLRSTRKTGPERRLQDKQTRPIGCSQLTG